MSKRHILTIVVDSQTAIHSKVAATLTQEVLQMFVRQNGEACKRLAHVMTPEQKEAAELINGCKFSVLASEEAQDIISTAGALLQNNVTEKIATHFGCDMDAKLRGLTGDIVDLFMRSGLAMSVLKDYYEGLSDA